VRRPIDDPSEASSATFNMTPMIDVVFQLIIFLMLANDMSRKDIEDLRLPEAPHGAEDTGLEKHRIVINLLKGEEPGAPPLLKVRGTAMDLEGLGRLLANEADLFREGGAEDASALHVLVRADAGVRWEAVQHVLQACVAKSVRVYRVQFATTSQPQEEEKP
jgi:biopolymer transport protein ExbD